jgi:hypothetical protein
VKPGDLVNIGASSKYNAVNRAIDSYVDVFPGQVGILLHPGSNDENLGFMKRSDLALFSGVILSFAPGVLRVVL